MDLDEHSVTVKEENTLLRIQIKDLNDKLRECKIREDGLIEDVALLKAMERRHGEEMEEAVARAATTIAELSTKLTNVHAAYRMMLRMMRPFAAISRAFKRTGTTITLDMGGVAITEADLSRIEAVIAVLDREASTVV